MSGLVGRIWTPSTAIPAPRRAGGLPGLGSPAHREVVFGHWVEPAGEASAIVSEARVAGTDRRATLRLHALWALVGAFERLIGGEALALAARRAR